MKILHLTLKRKPFEVMITGEKKYEIRGKSKWILSRLFDGIGKRYYDVVKFTNGYGNNKPYFVAEFKGFEQCDYIHDRFSNGLLIHCTNVWKINLGEIIEKGNLK